MTEDAGRPLLASVRWERAVSEYGRMADAIWIAQVVSSRWLANNEFCNAAFRLNWCSHRKRAFSGFVALLRTYFEVACCDPVVGEAMRRFFPLMFAAIFVLAGGVRAHAQAALLMEEPFGKFGRFNPTGHAAIYLLRVCAETPVVLRRCRPGELGAVISRYNRIDGYDWIAMPLVPYLYAVDDVKDIPSTANKSLEAELRDSYRREPWKSWRRMRRMAKRRMASGSSLSARPTTARFTASRFRRPRNRTIA